MQKLESQIDRSVNFVEEQLTGFLESRYVRKVDDYFICYLSSQTGCNRGCKFCHLTVMGQTSFTDAPIGDFLTQWHNVEQHYIKSKSPAKTVHFNFMARGEPLANKWLLNDGDLLLGQLGQLAKYRGLRSKFNISTIMPVTLSKSLCDVFHFIHPTIYYSLYSVKESFRQKWLPTAMSVPNAMGFLKEYQSYSKKIIKIHHTFIAGENDSLDDVKDMCELLELTGLLCEFNLVRYNPFSAEQGVESDQETLDRNVEYIRSRLAGKVQVIPRVGFDVKASCGMFVNG